jgi:uncharacterized protein YndB with AHSA1/START domain
MTFFSKLLAFLIALAVIAVAAAWIMGGESSKSSTRISIDASPEDVFRYLVDGEKIKVWGSDVVSAETFEGDDPTLGSKSRVVMQDGQQVVWEDTVMRFQTGEAVSIQSKKAGYTKTYVFQLEENDLGGTNVQYRQTQSAGGLERLMFPFQDRKNLKNDMAAEMTKLKNLVESEVDPPGSRSNDEEEDEMGSPVVGSQGNGDNDSSTETSGEDSGPESSAVSIVDQVLGPVYDNRKENKPVDGKRNFESLFGTGG